MPRDPRYSGRVEQRGAWQAKLILFCLPAVAVGLALIKLVQFLAGVW